MSAARGYPIAVGGSIKVYVSTPGSATLTGPINVTIPNNSQISDVVAAFNTVQIPHVMATTIGSNVVLTHDAGGVIILQNAGATDIVGSIGFVVNDPTNPVVSGVTVGAKYGVRYFEGIQSTTNPAGSTPFTVNVAVDGELPTFTVTSPGTGYAVNSIATVAVAGATLTVRVSAVTGNGVAAIEIVDGVIPTAYSVQLSKWEIFVYTPEEVAPTQRPPNNTNWFYSSVNQVDIMVNNGSSLIGYRNTGYGPDGLPSSMGSAQTDPNGPIVSASTPTGQSDGTPLAYGDLWLDTSTEALENYPALYRWTATEYADEWVAINNSDQTSENGIVFADARWGQNGTIDPVDDLEPTIPVL
jgi:hypothetical protein